MNTRKSSHKNSEDNSDHEDAHEDNINPLRYDDAQVLFFLVFLFVRLKISILISPKIPEGKFLSGKFLVSFSKILKN